MKLTSFSRCPVGDKYLALNGLYIPAYKRPPTKVALHFTSVAVQSIAIAGIVGAIAALYAP